MEKKKIEDEDIKLWHKIFYNKVCSQIRTIEANVREYNSEIDAYENLKSAVIDLNNDVDACALSLQTTYNYASSGVSCDDFNSNIAEIKTYGKNMEDIVESFNGVIKSINNKIEKLKEKISEAYAEISALKSSIGI